LLCFQRNNGSLPWLGETRTGVGWAQIGCPCSLPSSEVQKAKKNAHVAQASLQSSLSISNLGTIRKLRIYLSSNLTCLFFHSGSGYRPIISNMGGRWVGNTVLVTSLRAVPRLWLAPDATTPHPTGSCKHHLENGSPVLEYTTKEHARNRSFLCSVSPNLACMIFECRHSYSNCSTFVSGLQLHTIKILRLWLAYAIPEYS